MRARDSQAVYDRGPALWSQALDAHLNRSRRRIASAGLFDVALADMVQTELTAIREEIDAIAPTSFLHDTTTKNVPAFAGEEHYRARSAPFTCVYCEIAAGVGCSILVSRAPRAQSVTVRIAT
jgi:hypothetical protein